MDVNIRNAIIDNFKSLPESEIYKTIEEASSSKEEKTLPGLGVFFELVWKNASNEYKNDLVDKLSYALKA